MAELPKRYIVIDKGTGEEIDTDIDLSFLFKDSKLKHTEYFMIFLGIEEMMQNKELNGTDWRVFMLLCNSMKDGGWVMLTQDFIASSLGTFRPNVNKSINKLIECGYVAKERHPSTGRVTLRIAREIAGRGKYAVTTARRAIERRIKDSGK